MPQPPGKLFLIPNFLADDNDADFISGCVRSAVHHLKSFIVENGKEARALIKQLNIATPQQELTVTLWNEHSKKEELTVLLKLFDNGTDVGLITDAGLPCVADPGADVVAMAHKRNITVVPLPGASSILMALMASGLNGQGFTFHGYLPIARPERISRIRELEKTSISKRQSQIFIEAPYRNNHLFEDLVKNCQGNTLLCVASNVSAKDQLIKTKTAKEWAAQMPDLHKIPTVFIIG